MGTHNQADIEVAANAAVTTHTLNDTNTNTISNSVTKYDEKKLKPQQQQTLTTSESTESEKHYAYLPKASEPPQVIIIPATQASTVATNAAKKIRRAFSMPRNPFRWSRKFKTSATTADVASVADIRATSIIGGADVKNSTIISCVSGGRANAGSLVSLSAGYEAVAKDAVTTQIDEQQQISNSKAHNNICDNSKKPMSYNNSNNSAESGGNRVIRRSSLRKFLNRIAQHVSSSVNVGATTAANDANNSKTGLVDIVPFYTGCWRRKRANKNDANCQTNVNNQVDRTRNNTADRVPPITNGGYQWPADQIPGVMGLKNHGNTCFMNAVLQCLSHTDILAEYFVLDQYKVDLKRRNKINSRKFGTKGELTEQLANVLKALWTCKNESDHSTSFKAVVDRYGSQFRSSTQHDAQEFLFWLLDKVHEDLNTATKRRYKSVKNTYGRPDEVLAAETLANHIRCNNSFVQAVFQAQFRSSLTCPRCKKQSNTFDPFHCISVQLPQLTQQSVFVTVVYMKQQPRQVRMGITVPAGSPIVALRERLHIETGIATDRMVLVDINSDGFSRVYYDTQPVATLHEVETIYCIEVPALTNTATRPNNTNATISTTATTNNNANSHDCASKNSVEPTASELLILVACVRKYTTKVQAAQVENAVDAVNIINSADDEYEITTERFGVPFSMLVPRDCSYAELQKKLLREMSSWLRPEVFTYSTPLSKMFQIRLQDPSADPDTYLEAVEHPLLTEMIDLALSVLSAEAGPAHIKLLLEWMDPQQYFIDLSNLSDVVEHDSLTRLRSQKTPETVALSLEQCLEHYTKAETLSAEDAWRCPHCQQYLPVVKTLGLWSLPDILVIHFKRFRQHQEKGANAAKLTTMVKFPLNAFDMSPHLARCSYAENTLNVAAAAVAAQDTAHYRPSPWKRNQKGDSRSSTLNSRDNRETRYDLYAVCYHQGDTLETGHYTAACKNPYDRQWYKFDDQRVSKVPDDNIEQEIINNEAYMLFYQRRNVDVSECSGSSSNSGDHWVSRIAPVPIPTSVAVQEQPKLSTSEQIETKEILSEETEKISALSVAMATPPKSMPNIVINESEIITQELNEKDVLSENVTNKLENLIEELDFADAEISANEQTVVKVDNNIAQLENQQTTEDATQTIFVMDEDVVLDVNSKKPIVNGTTKISNEDSINMQDIETQMLTNGNVPTTATIIPHTAKADSPNMLIACKESAGMSNIKRNPVDDDVITTTTLLSSSLKSNSSSIIGATLMSHSSHEFRLSRHQQLQWNGSRSSVSSAVEHATQSAIGSCHNHSQAAPALSLRHSFSTSSNYKLRDCNETLSTMFRNSANTCSKDTLIFIDQQNHHHHHHHHHHNHHSLMEDDDDTFMDNRSLWISPLTPHKLITVSPKN